MIEAVDVPCPLLLSIADHAYDLCPPVLVRDVEHISFLVGMYLFGQCTGLWLVGQCPGLAPHVMAESTQEL